MAQFSAHRTRVQPGEPAGGANASGSAKARLAEALALLAAPLAVFFGLHVRAMPRTLMIDPYFYGAYALDGPDLLRRFGTDNYFWPRVGFILPDRLFVTLFGALGGFFTFRYLLAVLAIIPVYWLFVQVYGRSIAWVAPLAVLTAPVVLTAWGTDYPDSAAVSYLMAGAACLYIKPATPRGEWLLLASGGALLGLALNAQVISGLTVAGIIVARSATGAADGVRRLSLDVARVLAGAVAITALLVVWTAVAFGHWDIFRPTIRALVEFRNPKVNALFHSSTWRWLNDDIYVLLPPALLVVWLIAAWPVNRLTRVFRPELGFALAAAVAFTLHAFLQFAGGNWTLEYYLHSSMLWATVCPLLVFVAIRLFTAPSGRRVKGAEVVAAAAGLLLLPLLFRPFRDQVQLTLRGALVVAALAVGGAVLARFWRPVVAARLCGAVVALAALTLLVVGLPKNPVVYPGQVPYITPDYGSTTFVDSRPEIEQYAIFAALHDAVPQSGDLPGTLATWWPAKHSAVLNVASAQYLWTAGAIPSNMPNLDPATLRVLALRRPRVLVLLSDSGADFVAAENALTGGRYGPRVISQRTLRAGEAVLHVAVLELTAFPRDVTTAG